MWTWSGSGEPLGVSMDDRGGPYVVKLRDPRWQKQRLKILERDRWTCQVCESTTDTLAVHHLYYEGATDPWEYPDEALLTLCEECHSRETEDLKVAMRFLSQTLRRAGFMSTAFRILAKGFGAMDRNGVPDHEVAAAIAYSLFGDEGSALRQMLDVWKRRVAELDARRATREASEKSE